MKRIKSFLAGFVADQWSQYTPMGQMLFALSLVAIAVDAGISYQYGASMTTWHAWGCALVAIGCAIFPDLSVTEFGRGNKGNGLFFLAVAIMVGIVGFQNHLGYSAGVRVGDINHVSAQTVVHEDTRSTVDEDKAALKMWTERLAKLEADKGWTATVSADGLRGQVDAADEAIRQEEKRGGCGPKCLKLKEQRGALAEKIASAEEHSNITKQIEATRAKLNQARDKAAVAKVDNSPVVNQTQVNGQLYNLLVARTSNEDAIKPTAVVMTVANIFVAGGTSLAFMILAPAFYLGAGRNRRPENEAPKPTQTVLNAATPPKAEPASKPTHTVVNHTKYLLADPRSLAEAISSNRAPALA